MCIVHLHIYLCMNLPQAVSFPPQLRIDWDLSRRIPLVEEGELEPAVVGCSVAAPLFPAAPLQSRQARRGKTRPFRSRIAHDRLYLRKHLAYCLLKEYLSMLFFSNTLQWWFIKIENKGVILQGQGYRHVLLNIIIIPNIQQGAQ
jgi:hypothetical protein